MITSVYEVRACPECAGGNLSYLEERDQVVCRDCGLVYEPLTPRDEKRLERVSQAMKGSGLVKGVKRQVKKSVKKQAKKPVKRPLKKSVKKRSSSSKKRSKKR